MLNRCKPEIKPKNANSGDPGSQPGVENKSAISKSLWALWEAAPDKAKHEARERLRMIQDVEQEMSKGMIKKNAIQEVASRYKPSFSTIERYLSLVESVSVPDRLPALLKKYAGRTATNECSPEAREYFSTDFLRPEKPAAEAVFRRLKRAAKEHGWVIPSNAKWFLRRLRREVDPAIVLYQREGQEALERSYPAQERDHTVFRALEVVNADGHRFDLNVEWPDGEIRNPVMAAFQDVMSGKILGYRVDKSENSDSVRLAFGDMIEQFGIPRAAVFDNGRPFAGKIMTGGIKNRYRFKVRPEDPIGIMTQIGIEVHWCKPGHGQSKPVERAFRDLCEDVSRHPKLAGAYTGKDPVSKPSNYGSKAVPLYLFLKVLDEEIRLHNERKGRRSRICGGVKSFNDVFFESYQIATIRKATAEQRRLFLLAAESVSVSRVDGSVNLYGNRYHCDALYRFGGKKVIIRFDPDHLYKPVYAYRNDGVLIGEAQCVAPVGFFDKQAAREYAWQKARYAKKTKEAAAAEVKMTIAEAANLLPESSKPDEHAACKVIKPIFNDRSKWSNNERERLFSKGVANLKRVQGSPGHHR